jgi:2-dehydropantoate 2-reductase
VRYLVFGAGAVGSYLGGRLALSGQPVVFFDRPEVAQAIAAAGVHVVGDASDQILPLPRVSSRLKEACAEAEIILLCVKAYDCRPAADQLARLPTRATVLSLLNGIGNEDTLTSALGAPRVLPATLTSAVRFLAPGAVRVERERGVGLAGAHPMAARLQTDFEAAGRHPRLYSDSASMKWSKLVTNLLANATSAITGLTAGEIYRHPGLYRLEVEALRESCLVIKRGGHRLVTLPGVSVPWLGRLGRLPAALTRPLLARVVGAGRGDKAPSFAYDVGRGRSEVAWLNGAVAQEGLRLGPPAPANALLTRILMELVEGRIDPARYHRKPEALLAEAARAGVPGARMYNPVR